MRILRRKDEEGMALITVMLMLMVLTMLVVVTITAAVHSNDATGADKQRETAFAAASAGIDYTINCLKSPTLRASDPVNLCNQATTQLSDGSTKSGAYTTTVIDKTPTQTTDKLIEIDATGWAPTFSSPQHLRSQRIIKATYKLFQNAGFFDAIFAGGSSPLGLVDLKNSADINGTVYARSYTEDKNGLQVGDLIIVGDVTTKNNSTEHSIWTGGSVTMGNNGLVQTYVQACGSPPLSGNISIGNGGTITGNAEYSNTLSLGPGATTGSYTKSACPQPAVLSLPTYTYNPLNYSGWSIVNFSTVAAANACLAQVGASQAIQTASCGVALGDSDGTIGHSNNGTVIDINVPACLTPVSMGSATYAGNFTIVSNCPLSLNGTYTKAAGLTGNYQAVFISTSNTGVDDISAGIISADPTISVLLYTPGQLDFSNNTSIASGAAYGGSVIGKNSMTITQSNDLGKNMPLGFDFSNSVATTWTPVLTLWQEG
ncbi:MAG: PilX N-terminal domain-containing pilus assembly protein [Actinomycetota bacterium]